MHYPLFCLQFTVRFSSRGEHRLKTVYFWSVKWALFSRLIFPVTKPKRASAIQIRLNCGAVVTRSCFPLLRSTKWGPGEHWNHRIIFYLFYRFSWQQQQQKRGNTSPSSQVKDVELRWGAKAEPRGCPVPLFADGWRVRQQGRQRGQALWLRTVIYNRTKW